MTFALAGLLLAVGVAAVVAGGADDSPGLQAIGVAVVVGALLLTARHLRARRSRLRQ